MPSLRLSTTGCAEPSFGCAHGHTAKGSPPHHSVTAIGTTPRASRSSCSVNPALTTRLGGAGTLVSPNTCLTVTAPFADEPLDCLPEHAATTSRPVVPATPKKPRRLHCVCTCLCTRARVSARFRQRRLIAVVSFSVSAVILRRQEAWWESRHRPE